MKPLCAALALLLLAIPKPHGRADTVTLPVDDIGFCKPYAWLFGGWVAPPRIPLLGDVNGDGYADFLYASPGDKSIDVSLNGKGWKPLRRKRLLSGLPQEIEAMCLAHLGGKGLDIAVLGKQGGLVKALSGPNAEFSAPVPLCTLENAPGRRWLLVGKRAAGGADSLLVVTAGGQLQVVDASGNVTGRFDLDTPIVDAAAGDVDGDGGVELAVHTGRTVRLYRLGEKPVRFASIAAPRGREALAFGDINGDHRADLLINGRVYLAPDFKRAVRLPGWDKLTKPAIALMADVAGHGRADVVVQHEGPDYFGSTEADCDLYISYLKTDADWDCDGLTNAEEARIRSDPLDRSTSHDGLMDGWKVHGFAGIDFAGMGASPLHKDVLVMNLPYDTVPADRMESYMREKVAPFFARLPNKNLDGSPGIAVHWITETPALATKANEGKGWSQIAGERLPPDRIGLYHWMLVSGMGGGGQSGQLADAGSSGMLSWIHEFGHQLGLSHTGKWATWAPTYTSLMNYSFSYNFAGDREKVHFSTGELASLVLNESHLPGKVNFPIEKLQFLSGPPYHLHLKAAGKNATYVDWGWTGGFSDRKVRANITFGYSVSAGERLQPSGKQPFNYDGPYELMTDYQPSLAEHHGRLDMVTASRPPRDPKAPRPESATLVMQTRVGKRAWSAPRTIAAKVTNDPCAISNGRSFYVFYPTAEGLVYRFGSPDALGLPTVVPDSKSAYASAVNWQGVLLLFLYNGPDKTITYRTVRGKRLGPVVDLGIESTIPPGAAVDTIHNQLLLGTAGLSGKQSYRWQLRRLDWDADAGAFKEQSCAFVGGEKVGWAGNRRPTILFNPSSEFGPDGRIYWIAAGLSVPMSAPTSTFIAQTIGYKDVNDGWLLWRYYDEWTNTRSGIGAVWSGKDRDIIIATTWASGTAGGDGGVFCAYNGTAIGNVDMGDFDDVSLMANYGLERSIGTFAVMPAIGCGK